MLKPIFSYVSYKSYMKARLRSRSQRGATSRAAKALNCQVSFLSRVMNSHVHLTLDQAYLMAKHWKLERNESKCFMLLVEYDRSQERSYKDDLMREIQALKQVHESLSERMSRPAPEAAGLDEAIYFSSWHWTAVHFLTSVKAFQTIASIAGRLSLPQTLIQSYLAQLQTWGLVQEMSGRWIYSKGGFHLAKDSPFVVQHHQNWRTKAILDSQLRDPSSVHFTNVQTIAEKDIPEIKELLLKFVSETKAIMDPSDPEEAVVLICDFFKA